MRRCRPWLGTLVEIEADIDTAITAGFDAVAAVHRSMSAHDPASDISRINRGERVPLGRHLCAVLERSIFWFRASDGLFDPTAAGRRALASGALPLHPGQSEPGNADLSVLRLDGANAWLDRPACLDLGGIAKGHAVDAAVAAMRAAGAKRGLVNAGGDLAAFGEVRSIDIVDPVTRRPRLCVRLDNRALATSSGIIAPEGLDFGHLPVGAYHSVSVEAARAIDADALTKVAWAGHPRLPALLALADARAVAVDADGAIVDPARQMEAA